MCTAISYKSKDFYFGRNLDLERSYNESVVITPRKYELQMRFVENLKSHYAMIGMATVRENFPLYYEATNEKGLSMAGLNFPGNAVYYDFQEGKENITPFEFIPWVLSQCSCIDEAEKLMGNMNLVDANFSQDLPLTPLHWMISDKNGSLVVESLKDGIKIIKNPFGVLTNNPPFDYQKINLSNYMGLSIGPLTNNFNSEYPLENYSLGMGALGLPGDFSGSSRFVRAFFVKEKSISEKVEKSSVNQFFHILNSVAMPKGCVWTKTGYEYTRYTSCCNTDKGIYYYTTYDNFEITDINMYKFDLDNSILHIKAL